MSTSSEEEAAYTLAGYLRIASIAVALYDYLETLPKVLRFYREQFKSSRLTSSFVLFVLLRFTSIIVLVISSVGFFYNNFTIQACQRFFLLPPAFKVVQAMVTQIILGIRAWNLARRVRYITYFLCAIYFISCTLQWISTLYQRSRTVGGHQNCRAYNPAIRLGAYVYYAVAVIYDFAITSTSIFYLFKYKFTSSTSLMSKVTRMMLYDGIGYFVALAAVNLLNLMLYKNAQDVQTAAASLGYSVSWIMSQRLLLHLYDASCKRRDESHGGVITVSRPLESSRQVSYALRTQFEQKSTGTFELSVPDFADEEDPRDIPDEIEVQVRVEHSVKLDRRLGTFELENYSRSITRCSGGDLRSRQS